jgi:hypothetical protein
LNSSILAKNAAGSRGCGIRQDTIRDLRDCRMIAAFDINPDNNLPGKDFLYNKEVKV